MAESLWRSHKACGQRGELSKLRGLLDSLWEKSMLSPNLGFSPTPARALFAQNIQWMLGEPEHPRIRVDEPPDVMLADACGLAPRAIRMLTAGALANLKPDAHLRIRFDVEPTRVRMQIQGAAPTSVDAVARLARALGTDAGIDGRPESEAAWLSLPRA